MNITRRIFASGALAVPFLGKLGTADASTNSGLNPTFAVLDGLTELRVTDDALKILETVGITVYAVAPGTVIKGANGTGVVGVKLPAECGTVAVQLTGRLASGAGRLRGGVGMRSSSATMEIVSIRSDLANGRVFAFLKVNDNWNGESPVYNFNVDELRLVTESGLPGDPTKITGSKIALLPTYNLLDVFKTAFGSSVFTTDDVVVSARAEGRCWPLPPS